MKIIAIFTIGLLLITFDVCAQNRRGLLRRSRIVAERQPKGLRTPKPDTNRKPASTPNNPGNIPADTGADKKPQTTPPKVPSLNNSKAAQPKTSTGDRKNPGGIKVVPTVNPRRIIQTLEGYDPMHIPQPGEDKPRFIGSNSPVSHFEHKGEKIPVRVSYDQKNEILRIRAVDADGTIRYVVVDEYDQWSWTVNDNILDAAEAWASPSIGLISSGDVNIFHTNVEDAVPYDRLKALGIEVNKRRVQESSELFTAAFAVSKNGTPTTDTFFNQFFMEKYREYGGNFFVHPGAGNILAQVSANMKQNVKNPWLHYTAKDILAQKLPAVIAGLRPGRASQAGFLGHDDDFFTVMKTDNAYLRSVSVRHEQIADSLIKLISYADKHGHDLQMKLNGQNLRIKVGQTKGMQQDPFAKLIAWHIYKTGATEPSQYGDLWLGQKYPSRGSQDITVTNLKTGKSISFGDMAAHLIGDLHFFEGPGTSYRMDPKAFINVLGLEKLKD